MRVIAGIYRSRKLKAPDGLNTRPTMDRVKEAMFSIIGPRINGATVLDLFSGSGSLGIEALSRGAKEVYFNDASASACKIIKENLRDLGIQEGAFVTNQDYLECLMTLKKKISIVLLDPPYKERIYEQIIMKMFEEELITSDGLFVLEAEIEMNLELDETFTQKEYRYGNKKVIIVKGSN